MATSWLISRFKDELGHSPVVTNVVFCFILAGVEKIVEMEFACPCKPQWNAMFAAAFFVIPAIIVFLIMQLIHECRSPKCGYSIVPSLMWPVLLLLDGQYLVCAMTNWPGTFVSVDNSYLKWCTPTNTTRMEELMAQSHSLFVWSQGIGILLLIGSAIGLIVYGIQKCRKGN